MRFEMFGVFSVKMDGECVGTYKLYEDAEDGAVAAAKANRRSKVEVMFPKQYGEPEALAGDYSYGSDDWNDYHG